MIWILCGVLLLLAALLVVLLCILRAARRERQRRTAKKILFEGGQSVRDENKRKNLIEPNLGNTGTILSKRQ